MANDMKYVYDVIIIGGGPAGYTAALYCTRAGMDVLVIEKITVGGQMCSTMQIDNYPGYEGGIDGITLGNKMQKGAEKFGAKTLLEQVVSVDLNGDIKKVNTTDKTLYAKSVIVATGAEHKKLGIYNEEKLIGKGVGYCATCDGMFYKGKTVAVVGGGNSAVTDALYLSKICKKVILIHRRDTFRAAHSLVEKARHMDNIEFIIDTTVSEICGEDMVEKLMLTNVKTKEKTQLEVNGIFIAVGIVPDTDILQGVVEMDEKGYVLADELGNTNIPGIFVAGDCKKKKLRQIITAVADGANAVTGVEEYFNS